MASTDQPHILAVIPARYASTRFPGKIIAPLGGKPLVMHAYEKACAAELVSEVIIATDDERVVEAVAPYGARTILTSKEHATGTDRIAEVAAHSVATLIVNVQGDEALIDPQVIDDTILPLLGNSDAMMSTARNRIRDRQKIEDKNVVKVVCDKRGNALYFSRCPIPCIRDHEDRHLFETAYWQHIGLYVYRRDFLLRYARMAQTPLEKLEKLEQLRALENGFTIAVIDTMYEGIGVDVPEDLETVTRILARTGQTE